MDADIPGLCAFVEGHGRAVIMLGGGTVGAEGFAPHARELAQTYRVVRLQTLNVERALAQQPLPPGYSVKLEALALRRALDSMGLQTAVDVVGHSLGALVALDFALDHPDRVRSLVLCEPPALWVVPKSERSAAPLDWRIESTVRQFGPASDPDDAQFVSFLQTVGASGAIVPALGDPARDRWIARRRCLRGLAAVAEHVDDVARLRSLACAVFIVTGEGTATFHRRIDGLLASYLPAARHIFLPGGHSAVYTSRRAFVRVVRRFLAHC